MMYDSRVFGITTDWYDMFRTLYLVLRIYCIYFTLFDIFRGNC